MRERLVALACGVLFALGLALSGMTDPGKVLGFLDVTGRWDPSLAFVMGGAVGFHALWLRLARRTDGLSPAIVNTAIDARLVIGAAIFGVGWGLAGYCPGPALTSLAYGRTEALLFVLAMVLGVLLFRWFERQRHPGRATSNLSH